MPGAETFVPAEAGSAVLGPRDCTAMYHGLVSDLRVVAEALG